MAEDVSSTSFTPRTLIRNLGKQKFRRKSSTSSRKSSLSRKSGSWIVTDTSSLVQSKLTTPRKMLRNMMKVQTTDHTDTELDEFSILSKSNAPQDDAELPDGTFRTSPLTRPPIHGEIHIMQMLKSDMVAPSKKARVGRKMDVEELKDAVRPTFRKKDGTTGRTSQDKSVKEISFSPLEPSTSSLLQHTAREGSSLGKSLSFALPAEQEVPEDIDLDLINSVEPVDQVQTEEDAQEHHSRDAARKKMKKRQLNRSRSSISYPQFRRTAIHYSGNLQISSEAVETMYNRLDEFFETISATLNAYARHGKRKFINLEDFALLLRRAKWIDEKTSFEAFVSQYLTLEDRHCLIPCATSGNLLL